MHDDHFPIDVFQTGSGTSSNMNANEVIATLAPRPAGAVHPNDHVNASQSSNDVFPSSIHLAATEALATDVVPALDHLAATLRRRADDWADVVKAGRTHLMDAVPITLGQEADGWATQAEYGAARVRDVLPRLAQLPIGGTAVGTGLNAPDGFGAGVVDELRAATGLDILRSAPHPDPRAHPGCRSRSRHGSPSGASGGAASAQSRQPAQTQPQRYPATRPLPRRSEAKPQ